MNSTPALGEGTGLREGWAYPLAGAFLALAPLTTFLAHAGYSLATAESVLCLTIAAIGGLAYGALMAVGPVWMRIALAAVLVTLVVDIQSPWFKREGLQFAVLAYVLIAACFWPIRRRLGQVLALLAGATLLASFTVPAAPFWKVQGEGTEGSVDKPVFVQIILDEHIGLEGIPEEFDHGGALASALENRFHERGFTVFSRAYSRHYASERSISTVLNFDACSSWPPCFLENTDGEPFRMTENATANLLRARGYRLHVIQTPFIDLCRVAGHAVTDECVTYAIETVGTLQNLPLSTWTKSQSILSHFQRLSAILVYLRARVGLPEGRRISAFAAMAASNNVESMLTRARPGDAYLIHLLLPHFPFVYDASCQLRADSATWLNNANPAAKPARNTPESRRERYPLYLEQVTCTQAVLDRLLNALKASGVYDEATVVVHGDHGSRLVLNHPRGEFVKVLQPRDYIDAYSTLFAVKLAGVPPGTDRRILPLEELAAAVVREGKLPEQGPSKDPSVIVDLGHRVEERPLPDFARGQVEAQRMPP